MQIHARLAYAGSRLLRTYVAAAALTAGYLILLAYLPH